VVAAVSASDCDIVHLEYQTALYERHPMINGLPATLEVAGLRQPVVTRFHDLWGPKLFPGAGRLGLRSRYVAQLAARSEAALVSNDRHRRQLATLLGGKTEHLTNVPLGPGVPPSVTEEQAACQRQELGVREGELLGVYFGLVQSGTGKGLAALLKAIAETREIGTRWVCLGGGQSARDGRHQERLRRLAGSLGIADRVTWLGYVPDRQVSAVLSAADVCVLPYEDGAEFHRSSLVTVLSHRVPLVTTYVGCLPSPLRSGEHVLAVPAGDPAELGRAMSRLATDSGLREHLRANLAQLEDSFAWPSLARRTAAVYADVRQRVGSGGLGARREGAKA